MPGKINGQFVINIGVFGTSRLRLVFRVMPPPPTLSCDIISARRVNIPHIGHIISLFMIIYKTPPSPHRLFDLQDTLDKLMHFLPQLSDFVSLKRRVF